MNKVSSILKRCIFFEKIAGLVKIPEVSADEINDFIIQLFAKNVINESGDDVLLTQIPNYLATLMVDFTHDSPIQVQNVEARIYDRVNINNAASGVLTRVAEIVHPDPVQNDNGSGDTSWATPAGSAIILTLSDSPGISGWYASNGSSQRPDTVHRWHLALSASPSSVGSKALYGFYIECEYL